MRVLPFLVLLLASACSDSHSVMDDLPNSSIAGSARDDMPETRMESGLVRAVTIGEDGPRLDACGALGVTRGPGPTRALDLHAAPFADAKRTGTLAPGTRLHICTRSLDQRWLGVVVQPLPVPPAADPLANAVEVAPVDCGVSSPVESKRGYEGPCDSGWVSSAFVTLIAG
ncbi:MAG: hypothetical protein DI547_07365 [Sphingobium sp.]|nr:MAG: hypothetical protein DI547_07365 [Sphingobium sp.]